MNTPPAPQQQSPTRRPRNKPKTPLQERSQSQTNEESARLGREARYDQTEIDMFSATPFPTKPQHILLPSTIRKQRSFQDGENLWSTFHGPASSRPSTSGQNDSAIEEARGRKAPMLQLKRSVTTLRDMYEAQAEKSRPSTAASYNLRPGTSSSRLRSASSSEGLAGRNAWEGLHKVSSDDMALLPTLSKPTVERLAHQPSFASRAAQNSFLTSSPNYQTYGTSSSKFPVFRDNATLQSEGYDQSLSSGMIQTSSSSPNFVRLGRSSSIAETLHTEQTSSSPNFVKLGTSSSGARGSSSPTPSVASTESRKRKRDEVDLGMSNIQSSLRYSSSPPYAIIGATSSEPSLRSPDIVMPSSPPQPASANSQSIGTSSPIYRLPDRNRHPSDSTSSSSTHENLQVVLSSSPMPPIQYPIIRAPAPAAFALNVPKRIGRSSSTISEGQWISRLSPVPSEWDEGISRSGSKRSHPIDDFDEEVERSDSFAPEPTLNESQIHIIPASDDDHEHEATDELRALPRRGPIAYRSPPLVPVRTNSLYGTALGSGVTQSQSKLNSIRESMDTRLSSMKSFAHSRQNSFMSNSLRPGSSESQSTSVIVPTWARRYYSGLYRDSFQYLYPSQTNSAAQLSVPADSSIERTTSSTSGITQHRASTTSSRNRRRSWQSMRQSVRNTFVEYIPAVIIPKHRSRIEARKSHLTAGLGPLVSNPVDPETMQTRMDPYGENHTIRRISDQLPAADPRAHWAGVVDEQLNPYQNSTPYHSSRQIHRQSSESQSIYYDAASGYMLTRSRFTDGPHLHHDRRLNTGSSKSRGFGFPFNQKARHQAPSVYDGSARPSWFRMNLRDAQVSCFIIGFVCPISWFVGAFLPLPQRPESFEDIEKTVYDQYDQQGGQDLDIVARLRLERHLKGVEELKWQNARWWKRMNRWMCVVGLVVFILIIVLAVIGTRNHW